MSEVCDWRPQCERRHGNCTYQSPYALYSTAEVDAAEWLNRRFTERIKIAIGAPFADNGGTLVVSSINSFKTITQIVSISTRPDFIDEIASLKSALCVRAAVACAKCSRDGPVAQQDRAAVS
jgi:hypothetical protein